MKLGLIGCGKMGGALLKGILNRLDSVESAMVFDAYAPAMKALAEGQPKIQSAGNNRDVAQASDVVLLCVKPGDVPGVAQEIAAVSQPILCISVAAGVSSRALDSHLGEHQRAVRVMPNTPALVGEGAAAYTLGARATEDDGRTTKQLLESVGMAHEVPETLMDAVTGVSGSGPAYIYLVIEALSDAGVLNGLPRSTATELAAQTVLGAAKMVLETKQHPGTLKDQVTSPNGTTIRGIAALEAKGLRHAMIAAVNAATERSREMAANSG